MRTFLCDNEPEVYKYSYLIIVSDLYYSNKERSYYEMQIFIIQKLVSYSLEKIVQNLTILVVKDKIY
jgi:hypothetical protein